MNVSRVFVVGGLVLIALIALLSCSGDDPVTPKNQPPSEPQIAGGAPPNDGSGVSLDPTLRWTCTDPEDETIYYDVHFGTSDTPVLVSSAQTASSYKPSELDYNTRYYWRVVAEDEQGERVSSETWTFMTRDKDPMCSVTPETLDFGELLMGESKSLSFSITNTGGGTLVGGVTAECSEFTITTGYGMFNLEAGEKRTVVVSYTPSGLGDHTCAVSTGCESDVNCLGTGVEEPPQCFLSSTTILFGNVELGSYKEATFTIRNNGDGILEGFVSESCEDFSIVSGLGNYSLAGGENHSVTVRYEPSDTGASSCVIYTGCDDEVGCLGSGVPEPAVCSIDTDTLDFGEVYLGTSAQKGFTIANVGGSILEGRLESGCDEFVLAGDTAYSLAEDDSLQFLVDFVPGDTGKFECYLSTGCDDDIVCLGTGVYLPPTCALDDEILDFGEIELGDSRSMTTYLRNAGSGTLTGTVSSACTDFIVQEGIGDYELAFEESHEISVLFVPADTGLSVCTVLTDCATPLVCQARGVLAPPECQISPVSLDFGQVAVGFSKELNIIVTNVGGSVLNGSVSESCGEFSIVGSSSFALQPTQSQAITIRFEPQLVEPVTCLLFFDSESGCSGPIECRGEGLPTPPICDISPTELNFGNVEVGQTASMDFVITNSGGGTLQGKFTESCDDFDVAPGDDNYNLGAGEFKTITIEYTPDGINADECWIFSDCDDSVRCIGAGISPSPECLVSPTELDFGDVQVGVHKDLSFTITNTAGGTLSGSVSEACDDFSLVAGEGDYDLTNGQSYTVTVRLEPSAEGDADCVISTGCADDVDARGVGAPPCIPAMLTPVSGDIWCRLSAKYITWDVGDCDNVWDVDLYQDGALVCNLEDDLTSDGDLLWTVSDCGNGSADDYQIRVTNVSTGAYSMSDYFTIEVCAPNVTVPMGGENYCLGGKLTIEWSGGTCPSALYDVHLYKDDSPVGTILSGDLNTSYLWTIDDFAGGDGATYRIKVTNTVSGCIDYSGYFAIEDCPK